MPSIEAIASAHTPWWDCGWISWRWAFLAPIGRRPFFGQRHHLGATADGEVLVAGHHHRRGEVVGRDARAAEAVERHAAGAHVVAGVERRHATEVAALLADLRAGAPDDVVDVGGVEAVAIDERLEHRGGDVLGVEVGERPLPLLADAPRRAACVDDECFSHRHSLGRGRAILSHRGARRPSAHAGGCSVTRLDRRACRRRAWPSPKR